MIYGNRAHIIFVGSVLSFSSDRYKRYSSSFASTKTRRILPNGGVRPGQ